MKKVQFLNQVAREMGNKFGIINYNSLQSTK